MRDTAAVSDRHGRRGKRQATARRSLSRRHQFLDSSGRKFPARQVMAGPQCVIMRMARSLIEPRSRRPSAFARASELDDPP